MEIEYVDSQGNTLCFKHAVKKVIDNDEDIRVSVDTSDPGESGCYSLCVECYKDY